MGCDIHLYVERKVDNVWQQVPEEETCQRIWAPISFSLIP